jgi:hypothetical protein
MSVQVRKFRATAAQTRAIPSRGGRRADVNRNWLFEQLLFAWEQCGGATRRSTHGGRDAPARRIVGPLFDVRLRPAVPSLQARSPRSTTHAPSRAQAAEGAEAAAALTWQNGAAIFRANLPHDGCYGLRIETSGYAAVIKAGTIDAEQIINSVRATAKLVSAHHASESEYSYVRRIPH